MMSLAVPRPTPPPPPDGAQARISSPSSVCHAVSRSDELLSCARTALRLAQERQKQAEAEGRDLSANGGDNDALPDFLCDVSPDALSLHSGGSTEDEESQAQASTADALQLVAALDSSIADLSTLVRRRGHTNDPTAEIDACCRSFQAYAKELVETAKQIREAGTTPLHGRRSSAMRRRHYEYVSDQIKKAGEKRVAKFKKVLAVRGEVIKDQNRRRRMLNPSTNKSGSGGLGVAAAGPAKLAAAPGSGNFSAAARSGMSQLESPLFTMTGTGGPIAKPPKETMESNGSNGSAALPGSQLARQHSAFAASSPGPSPYGAALHSATSAPSSMYGNGSISSSTPGSYAASASGYGGSYGGYGGGGYGGYGGGYGAGNDMGMRRRPNAATSASGSGGEIAYPYRPENDPSPEADSDTAEGVNAQIRARKARRETQNRLEEARRAESKLSELTTMFGKMADLVVQQGETLEKIEDDVEAAHGEISLGHDEIVKVHAMTKGNRALILKVFGILIFFIVFMRFY